jgi:hypothetical protein
LNDNGHLNQRMQLYASVHKRVTTLQAGKSKEELPGPG